MRNGIWVVAAMIVTSGLANGDDGVPASVRDEPRVRFLICMSEGPLIVQLTLTTEGRPYRHAAEDQINEWLGLVAPAGSSRPTWADLFEQPRLRTDLFGRDADSGREKLVARFDVDRDGRVARNELREAFLSRLGGEILRLIPGQMSSDPDGLLYSLVDVDGDWRLSRQEIDGAAAQIARLDFTGDEAITLEELQNAPRKAIHLPSVGVLLAPHYDPALAIESLRMHYADGNGKISRDAFQVVPDLFDRLDADRNGELSDEEVSRIGSLPPQIVLANDQHDAAEYEARLLRTGISQGLVAQEDEGAPAAAFHRWRLARSRLDIHGLTSSAKTSAKAEAESILQQYDRNKNGYLEPAEARLSERSRFRPEQFADWDADGDRQIFRHELEAAFERRSALSRCWFQIVVTPHPPPLWTLLNLNKDQALSAREMRAVRQRLEALDADGDGDVSYRELPNHIVVQIARGDRTLDFAAPLNRGFVRVDPYEAPKWFRLMDINLDGDVSQREFLGTLEQFQRLDADRDGLIDVREAEAAKSWMRR